MSYQYNVIFTHILKYSVVRGVKRPMLQCEFHYQDMSYNLPMLIDSGADNIVLPDGFRDAIGLKIEECTPVKANTYNGEIIGYKSIEPITFELMELSFPSISHQVHFGRNLDPLGYGLLGREALRYFKVCFEENVFYLGNP